MTAGAGPSDDARAVEGEQLPTFEVQLTLQRLVMETGANRDFAPIHFDIDAARESGAPNVYANTTFIETLFEALIRSWAGLAARIRVIEFAMKSFNCVGDEIAAGGEVTACRDEHSGYTAELRIWIDGPRGRTVTGTAAVLFPKDVVVPRKGKADRTGG
jgi:acyl dehydratase